MSSILKFWLPLLAILASWELGLLYPSWFWYWLVLGVSASLTLGFFMNPRTVSWQRYLPDVLGFLAGDGIRFCGYPQQQAAGFSSALAVIAFFGWNVFFIQRLFWLANRAGLAIMARAPHLFNWFGRVFLVSHDLS